MQTGDGCKTAWAKGPNDAGTAASTPAPAAGSLSRATRPRPLQHSTTRLRDVAPGRSSDVAFPPQQHSAPARAREEASGAFGLSAQ